MNIINGLSNETQLKFTKILGQVTEEIYKSGFEAGKVTMQESTTTHHAEHPAEEITHGGLILRKVNRRAKKGDYVRFSNLPIDTTSTDCDELYEVKNYQTYESDSSHTYHVYGWDACRNPEIFEVVGAIPQIEISANQQRAELIKKAKQFVEGIIGSYDTFSMTVNGFKNQQGKPVFQINENKRTVNVLIYGGFSKELLFKGFAKCDPGDVFNEWIGKAIALARALEIDIPVEFLEAVQPAVAIGQIVEALSYFTGESTGDIGEVKGFRDDGHPNFNGSWASRYKITDDTNAQYEVTE